MRRLLEDFDSWELYPQHRKWFDKLYLSLHLGYLCGPSGVAPTVSADYIVRPTYNLSGMSVGAKITYIQAGDYTQVPPGYFWCELFTGDHVSVNYSLNNGVHIPVSAWLGEKSEDGIRFSRWYRTDKLIELPEPFRSMSDVADINAEFIDGKLIEVHFRESPDPDYDEFIPVWEDNEEIIDRYTQQGYSFIENEDDANGFLDVKRKGFLINDQNRI